MKLNIAVLFGHLSCEHDISIITACQAMKNIDKNRLSSFVGIYSLWHRILQNGEE